MKITRIPWLAAPALLVGLVLGVAIGRSRVPFAPSAPATSLDYIIELARGMPTSSVSPAELQALSENPARLELIDVRERDEFMSSRIPGATSIPLGELWTHQAEILRDRAIVVYCTGELRSEIAARALSRLGYLNVRYLQGGISAWQDSGLPVVR